MNPLRPGKKLLVLDIDYSESRPETGTATFTAFRFV